MQNPEIYFSHDKEVFMPLYAILHSDIEGVHEKSCTLVQAASPVEIAQHMLTHPNQWEPLLYHLYPDDQDPRSLWQQVQTGRLSPEQLLALIEQTYCDEPAEMMRIQQVQIQPLDQVCAETRWIHSDVSNLSDNIADAVPISMTQSSFSTVEELVAAYTQLRQRKGRHLSAHLNQLKQQVVVELEVIHQQELDFTSLQFTLLEQLRSHFAKDARSLLITAEFQRFVQSIFVATEGAIGATPPLQVAPTSTDWLLNTLPQPLQLWNIQIIKPSHESGFNLFGVEMQVNLGSWLHTLTVPIDGPQDGLLARYRSNYTTRQWIEVSRQLQKNLTKLPISTNLQLGLAQELVCLLTYIGELFNIVGIGDRIDNLRI